MTTSNQQNERTDGSQPDAGPLPSEAVVQSTSDDGSRSDEWVGLFDETNALVERRELFDAAFDQIGGVLHADPEATALVRRILSAELHSPPENWLGDITESLTAYLGQDGTMLLHWLAYAQTSTRLESVAAIAPMDVTRFLRSVLSEHGGLLDRIQRLALASPDDWIRVSKNAYFDVLSSRYTFELVVSKVDQSVVRLQCGSDSLMRLTLHLLGLVMAPQDFNIFPAASLQMFAETLTSASELLGQSRAANVIPPSSDDQSGPSDIPTSDLAGSQRVGK